MNDVAKKVVFCTPFLERPTEPYITSLESSIPFLDEAGWTHQLAQEMGCPYISGARATLTRRALDAEADVIVYIDYDLSWDATDLLTLIETEGDVVAGTYRFKKDEEEYMGGWHTHADGRPMLRDDGCFKATRVPAGFLKVTKEAISKFMRAYPQLCYGPSYKLAVDLFNHGAIDGVWHGEDYAFCKRWIECGGEIALIPDLNINHHGGGKEFRGNLHEFMLRQPGGSKASD